MAFPEEDLNLMKNNFIITECAPLVYRIVIKWGFAKPDGVRIIDHFQHMRIEERSGRNLRMWLKKNGPALEATDFSTFDVTTLHDLLPVLCYDRVSHNGSSEWEARLRDPNSIEIYLKEIKDYRNEISHGHSRAGDNSNIEAMKDLMKRSLRTAGALYGKDQTEIDARVADLDAKLDELERMKP